MATPKNKTPSKTSYTGYSKFKKLPRPRRKGHYITGSYASPKSTNGPSQYRSGWELVVLEYLDWNPQVVSFEYEPVAIPYISNAQTGKVRHYHPDFIVQFADGRKLVVEVKRQDKIMDLMVRKKTEAGKRWAEERGMQYQIWSNHLIFKLKELNEGVKKMRSSTAKKANTTKTK